MLNRIVNCSDGIKNSSPLDRGAVIKVKYFVQHIFQPLGQGLGRYFCIYINKRYWTPILYLSFVLSFFSTKVITTCFCEFESSPYFNLDFPPTNFHTRAKKQGKIQRLSRRFRVINSFGRSAKHRNTLRIPPYLPSQALFLSSTKEGISLRSLKNEEKDPMSAHVQPS